MKIIGAHCPECRRKAKLHDISALGPVIIKCSKGHIYMIEKQDNKKDNKQL